MRGEAFMSREGMLEVEFERWELGKDGNATGY
jgi:hypothetical protein